MVTMVSPFSWAGGSGRSGNGAPPDFLQPFRFSFSFCLCLSFCSAVPWWVCFCCQGFFWSHCPLRKSTSLFGHLKHSTSSIWWPPLAGDDEWTGLGAPVTGHLIVYFLWIVGVASKSFCQLQKEGCLKVGKTLSSCFHVQWKKERGVSFRISIF